MGYHTEINTLLGLPKDFDTAQLKVGETYTIVRDRERVFPLHIALLLVTPDFRFLGYVVAHSIEIKELKSQIEFEVISLFSKEEQEIYSTKFLFAAKYTGELK